jgi:hypothetical protein
MRTITTTTTVYRLDELSEAAREAAYDEWREDAREYAWDGETRDIIKAFEAEFGIRIRDWSYSSWSYDYSLDLSGLDDETLALAGKRADAWFWNNHAAMLATPRTKYYTHVGGKLTEAVSADSRRYRSKVFADRVYNGTCPLTGYCLDCDALDPIAYFCYGVRWDDAAKKRVPSRRDRATYDRTTVEDLLREAVESLFKAIRRDCEASESYEAFEDFCAANGYEFTEDGHVWTGLAA